MNFFQQNIKVNAKSQRFLNTKQYSCRNSALQIKKYKKHQSEINKSLLKDAQIINQLESLIVELKEDDKDKVLQYIFDQYRNYSFAIEWKALEQIFIIQKENEKANYKHIYQELKQKKELDKFQQQMKNREFCRENNISQKLQENQIINQKLGDKFFDLLDLLENQTSESSLSWFQSLKLLLQFIYCTKLLENEQYILEQTIGSILVNQIYQLQIYIDETQSEHVILYRNFIDQIQNKQKQTEQTKDYSDEISKSPKLSFLWQLLTIDIRKGRQNLDQYLSKLLNLNDQITPITYELIVEQLENFLTKDIEIQECYFVVVWYFWAQYSQSNGLQDKIYQLSVTLEQVKPQRKMYFIQDTLSSIKEKKDAVITYFSYCLIFFNSNLNDFLQMQEYQGYSTQQEKILNQFKSLKLNDISLLFQNKEYFDQQLAVVQQMPYMMVKNLKIQNDSLKSVILLLFAVENKETTYETFKKLFHEKQDNILSCALLIEKEISQSKTFLQGFLNIVSEINCWQSTNVSFFHKILKFYGSLDLINKDIFQQILQIHYLKEKKDPSELRRICLSVYQQDPKLYKELFEPLKYYNQYLIRPEYFRLQESKAQYPFNLKIQVEDFNISLIDQDQYTEIVKQWVSQMADAQNFRNLIPFYFNIIKRQESSDQFVKLINSTLENLKSQQRFNMKALFQLLYNNSNEELKVTLLKLYSVQNPIPFIFQNPDIATIANEEDLFQLNYNIFYVWQSCYPIINFSFSKNNNRIGKTELLNKIFYEIPKFQSNDDCLLNANTIDAMFDFSFNGTRNFLIADTHGNIPFGIMKRILHLFKFWIIQMNDDELEENYEKVKEILQSFTNDKPKICFLVRNAIEEQQDKKISIKQNIQAEDIKLLSIHSLIEIDKATQFICTLIEPHYISLKESGKLVESKDFLKLANSFNPKKDKKIVDEINSHDAIIQKLNGEFNNILDKTKGCIKQEAFPMRNLQNQIKQQSKQQQINKQQIINQNFDNSNKEISVLEQKINEIQPTNILNIFSSMFYEENYYSVYILFIEQIKLFNVENKFKEEQRISIDMFWRELIQMHQKCQLKNYSINPIDVIFELIEKGEAFELLDGDQLKINEYFLDSLSNQFKKREKDKILIMSILGPQNTGKSTLLNKIFGCHFLTSAGRCTKGIYLAYKKIYSKPLLDNLYDSIFLLDTEGLDNSLQKDPEFDKKIAMLTIQSSDIIIMNDIKEIRNTFESLITMTIFSLKEKIAPKQISWCFNQNENSQQTSNEKAYITRMAESLNKEVRKIDFQNEMTKIDYHKLLDYSDENIKSLGYASGYNAWENGIGMQLTWRRESIKPQFSKDSYQFGFKLIKLYIQRLLNKDTAITIPIFFKTFQQTWNNIQKLPDLLEFSQLHQHQQNEYMKEKFQTQYKIVYEKANLKDKIPLQLEEEKKKITIKHIRDLDELETSMVTFLTGILEEIKTQMMEFLNSIQNAKQSDEKKISEKIMTKYTSQLEDRIKCEYSDWRICIIEQIKQLEQKYLEKNRFDEIEDFLTSLKQDNQKFESFRELPFAVKKQKYDEIWKKIKIKQETYSNKIFEEFQRNIFETIQNESNEYNLRSNNMKTYYEYCIAINQKEPDNLQKQEIFKMFSQELDKSQFVLIGNSQYHQQMLAEFKTNIIEKIRKSTSNIINLKDFYDIKTQWKCIKRSDVENYFSSEFYQDLEKFIQDCQAKKSFKLVKNFFSIFELFEIKYDQTCLDNLLNKIQQKSLWEMSQQYNSYMSGVKNEFANFKKKLNFTKLQDINQTENFSHNLHPSITKFIKIEEHQSIEGLQEKRNKVLSTQIILHSAMDVKPKDGDIYFEYIKNQNEQYQATFFENFPGVFHNLMTNKQGWSNMYYSIYEYIEKQFQEGQNSEYRNYLIKGIMGDIWQEIIKTNELFQKFGLVLSDLGIRCIYQFSKFIIWRFTCHKKYKILSQILQKFDETSDDYQKKWDSFQAEINKDILKQCKNQASTFCQLILNNSMSDFYLEKKSYVEQKIEGKQIKTANLVKTLDDEVLKYLQPESSSTNLQQTQTQKNSESNRPIRYIQNQKLYIDEEVKSRCAIIQTEIINDLKEKINQETKIKIKPILQNANTLNLLIGVKYVDITEYFNENNNKNEQLCEQNMYKIVVNCLLGNKQDNPEILHEKYKECFLAKFEKIKIQESSEEKKALPQISSLKHFLVELIAQLQVLIDDFEMKKYEIDLNKLEIQKLLDELAYIMKGCKFSCPMCKRKCDLQNDNHKIHMCQNGHFLRGMNGVMLGKYPSWYTCEEIDQEALIKTSDNTMEMTWKEMKMKFPDWNFDQLQSTTTNFTKHKENMETIWNGSTGRLICAWITQTFGVEAVFRPKADKNVQEMVDGDKIDDPVHIIFILDDSGSMHGQKWENCYTATLSVMSKSQRKKNTNVSVIIFNDQARLVIDFQKINIEQQRQLIAHEGGCTDFEKPFQLAYQQVLKHQNEKLSTVILFYTDGEADYPRGVVENFKSLPQSTRNEIVFTTCTESNESQAQVLKKFAADMKPNIKRSELIHSLKTSAIESTWSEIVNKNYHQIQ